MSSLLEARDLVRSFGSVQALHGTDFTVRAGEVVGLVGDNGAGKSTLVEVLSGNLTVDSDQIYWEGEPTTLDSPIAARELGIETVHQNLGRPAFPGHRCCGDDRLRLESVKCLHRSRRSSGVEHWIWSAR